MARPESCDVRTSSKAKRELSVYYFLSSILIPLTSMFFYFAHLSSGINCYLTEVA